MKKENRVPLSELRRLGGFELQLELVRNQGDELRVGGLSLGVADGIAEETLEGIQVPSVPCNLNGVAECSLYSAGSGLEDLCHQETLRTSNVF